MYNYHMVLWIKHVLVHFHQCFAERQIVLYQLKLHKNGMAQVG